MSHEELAVEANGPKGARRIVLVHGSMDRMAGFAKVARRLADSYRVVRYDRRGYGRSREHPGPWRVSDHIDDLLWVIGDREVVLVGHSLGGNLALGAAQRLPDQVKGVVTYESPLAWMAWWQQHSAGSAAVSSSSDPAEVAEAFLRRMIGHELWERLPEATREARRAEGRALVGEITSLQEVAPWEADRIRVPVIAGRGTKGRPHHMRGMEVVAESIDGAELVTIDGADHNAHATHPDEFTDQLVRPLLARVGW